MNELDWWRGNDTLSIIPINMSWHDLITTQFQGRIHGGASANDDIEHPLRVGAPIPGIASELRLASPLSTLLNEKETYEPLLLEEPSIEDLEQQYPVFWSQIMPIAGWLYDYQILPSYRDSWLPSNLTENITHQFYNTPSSMATTDTELMLLQVTHRKKAETEIQFLN